MRRRGFLQMLGGAVAAPLLPSASFATASKAAYPASALHAAIYHAQQRVNFSVFALAQQLGLRLDQAEQLMADMSARGIVGPLQGSTQAGRWARSKVWRHPVGSMNRTPKAQRTAAEDAQVADQPDTFKEPDLSKFMAHLYDLCRSQGMALHPRCAA